VRPRSFSFIHPGHCRKVNEDSFYANDQDGLWIVCDGMGGHDDGLYASSLATDCFEALELNLDFEGNTNRIIETIHVIKKQLDKKVSLSKKEVMIGTTLILLYIEDNKGFCINAGDSRCYIVRDNTLSLISMDHTKELINEYGSQTVLTNALFSPGDVSIDIKKFNVQKEDVFLLCSDGLYNSLENKKIKQAMNLQSIELGLKSLSNSVLSTNADDNITGIIVGVL